jgi:hypothetical protein
MIRGTNRRGTNIRCAGDKNNPVAGAVSKLIGGGSGRRIATDIHDLFCVAGLVNGFTVFVGSRVRSKF